MKLIDWLRLLFFLVCIVIFIFWTYFSALAGIYGDPFACHVVGLWGTSHVPANCIKYFIH